MAEGKTQEQEGAVAGDSPFAVEPTESGGGTVPAEPGAPVPTAESPDQPAASEDVPGPEPAPPEAVAPDEETSVRHVLRDLVNMIGIRARIDVDKRSDGYYANIKARQSNGLLIGRRGGTLRSIQYLTRLIVKQNFPEVPPITVDVSGYRARRENFLRKKATAVARIVLETRREMALDLLTEKETEVVQEALKPLKGVRVYALGAGSRKNVIIAPTGE